MDFEGGMKMLLSEENMDGDTFAERAEWYYQKRPQLLALLHDLYNGYTALLDRCNRLESKGNQRNHSSCQEEEDWDAESSLSYQQSLTDGAIFVDADRMVADLVIKSVEKDILVDQVSDMEQQGQESWRKIDLLKKLLEVLESERMVLLNENGRLVYKVQALVEENKGLSCEAMFLKRKAAELAGCVLKMREDQRVYMLMRKIEDLQGQIYGLESRNKEYYQQLLMNKQQSEKEEKSSSSSSTVGGSGYLQVALVGCFQVEKLKLKKRDEAAESCSPNDDVKSGVAKRAHRWWERVKSMDFFMCGLHHST